MDRRLRGDDRGNLGRFNVKAGRPSAPLARFMRPLKLGSSKQWSSTSRYWRAPPTSDSRTRSTAPACRRTRCGRRGRRCRGSSRRPDIARTSTSRAVAHRRVVLGRAHPHRIIGEGAVGEDRLVEIDRGVDDRLLAEMALHLLEHHLHVGDRGCRGRDGDGRFSNPESVRRRAPAAGRPPRPARSARTRRLPRSAGGTNRRSDRRRGECRPAWRPPNWPGSARRDGRRLRSP